jgi:hypothetical protein
MTAIFIKTVPALMMQMLLHSRSVNYVSLLKNYVTTDRTYGGNFAALKY